MRNYFHEFHKIKLKKSIVTRLRKKWVIKDKESVGYGVRTTRTYVQKKTQYFIGLFSHPVP